MKAIVLKDFGSTENLVIQDIPIPTIKDDEVLIKVKAISINPVDVKLRAGGALVARPLSDYFKEDRHIILGWDVSGEITELGKSVKNLEIGDEVFGMINFIGHGKAYAEYVAAPASQLALKPKNISHTEAAAATLSALTAWQALTKSGSLKKGDRILIHAASGGVGHYAIQMAKHLGAYVIGISSDANKEFVLGLGADEHINYRNQRFEEVATDIDFILESIGEENLERSLQVIKPKGTIVVINLPSGFTEKHNKAIKDKQLSFCKFMPVESSGSNMKTISVLLGEGIIKSHVSRTYSFDQMAQAHLQLETGHTVGKAVIEL